MQLDDPAEPNQDSDHGSGAPPTTLYQSETNQKNRNYNGGNKLHKCYKSKEPIKCDEATQRLATADKHSDLQTKDKQEKLKLWWAYAIGAGATEETELLLEMPSELEGGQEIFQLLHSTCQTLPSVLPVDSSQLMWELEKKPAEVIYLCWPAYFALYDSLPQ